LRVLLIVLALLLGHLPALAPQTAVAQPAPAQAQQSGKRVALVVGIGGYQFQSRLQATPKDARDMGALLQGLGFQLTTGTALVDPDKRTFDLAVRQFQRDATGAEMAIFYYSGHGMQIDGRNWMIPTDGRSTRPSELVAQHVGLHEISAALERAQPKLSMLILDACRNNPNQATRAAAVVGEAAPRSGLASVQAPAGTVIAYATAPDTTAADGPPGGNSPYTAHLMNAMRTPGLDIFRVFNKAALDTRAGTNGQQSPWVSFSPIDGDFYFVGRGEQPPTPVPVANAPPRPSAAPPAPSARPESAPQQQQQQQQQQAALPPPQQGERNASFTLVNLSGKPISDLRASLDTDTNWGNNRISRGQQLGDRKTIGVTLPAGSCKADLRLVPDGGEAIERRGLETCRFTTMVLYRDMSVSPSNPDVAIVNGTGRPIVALYASLTNETSWGRTRGNLAPGARVQVGFQQGAGCTVDIRAEFADGQPLERRRIDTCSSDEYVLR
jgi:hypothetical protein